MKVISASGEFIATKFSTCDDKAWFANYFFHFVETGCPQQLFTKRFYHRLSLCFGHIAHHDLHGFAAEWFSSAPSKAAFVQHALNHPPMGDPAFTYSDVERAIQGHLRTSALPALYEMQAKAEVEAEERRLLNRLKAKYEGLVSPPPMVRDDAPEPRPMDRDDPHPIGQMDLFG